MPLSKSLHYYETINKMPNLQLVFLYMKPNKTDLKMIKVTQTKTIDHLTRIKIYSVPALVLWDKDDEQYNLPEFQF